MDTFDYRSNSHKSKAEQETKPKEREKLEKVVTGTVTIKQKSGFAKFFDSFFGDSLKNVGSYLRDDVFIPAAKRTIVDLVNNGIEGVVYGSRGRDPRRSPVDKVSYNEPYYDYRSSRYPQEPVRNVARFDYDMLSCRSRGDAEMVLTRLDEVIATYGQVRVSDLYDLLGVSCDYTYNDYGWTNLSTARVVPLRGGGYGFDLPRANPLHR